MELTNEHIAAAFTQHFSEGVKTAGDTHGILSLETDSSRIIQVLTFAKESEILDFNFLTSLCAVHYPERIDHEITMVYMLHSFRKNKRLRIKVNIPVADPKIPTATTVWPSANWMERQEYDFFGIQFTGHPDLRRILNVDDMDVFPMRKEYRLEDGTRTDKDDRYFGRDGHEGRSFDDLK